MHYLSYPALLLSFPSKALSRACPKAVLMDPGSAMHSFAQHPNPTLLCQHHPESALVLAWFLPCPYCLSLPVHCRCQDKSPNNCSTHEYIRETLTSAPHESVFPCIASRRQEVTIRHDPIPIIWRLIKYFVAINLETYQAISKQF